MLPLSNTFWTGYYVDGRYVTSKAEPGDVDVLVITPQASTRDLVLYLDQVCPVEAVSVSIEVEPTLPNPLFDLFTKNTPRAT